MPIIMFVIILLVPFKSFAGQVEIRAGSGPLIHGRVTSLREARFKRIVAQENEFSCGSAALATLLDYHFGLHLTEREIMEEMFKNGNQKLIRRKGFSLLDLKKYAERKGYRTGGFKINMTQLKKVRIPAILLIRTRNYSHFVVFKKVLNNEVLLADPALGNRVMTLKDFAKAWNNVVLLIDGPKVGTPLGLSLEARMKPNGQSWRTYGIDLGFLRNPAEF